MKFNSFISSLMQGKWNLGNWNPYRLGTLCINIQRYIYIYTKTHTGISTSINKLRIFGIYKILNDSFITAKMKNVKGKKRKNKQTEKNPTNSKDTSANRPTKQTKGTNEKKHTRKKTYQTINCDTRTCDSGLQPDVLQTPNTELYHS